MKNLYVILGVNINASEEEIKKTYFNLVKIYHPDMNKNKSKKENELAMETFIKITAAYEILSDKSKKKIYDKKLHLDICHKEKEYFCKLKQYCNKEQWKNADHYVKLLTQISTKSIFKAYQAMINIYLHKDIEKNLNICKKLCQKHMFEAKFYLIKAKAFLGAGKKEEARLSVIEALKWNPDNKEAMDLKMKLPNKLLKKENLLNKIMKKMRLMK